MPRPARITLCLLFIVPSLLEAAPRATNEILAALQTRLENNSGFEDLIAQLSELEPAELARLQTEYDQAWPRLRDAYLDAFKRAAKEQNSGAQRQDKQKLIRKAREDFHRVRGLPEGPMKEALKATSSPAVDQLRKLLVPSGERILELAGENLSKQRNQVVRLATFRDGILKAAISVEPPESEKGIYAAEGRIAGEFSELDRDGLRIMEKNRKIAAESDVPEAERAGIEDLNLMRLLVGLNTLVLDPRLCEASRDHSQDMSKLGFFSHTSPVAGKQSFTARAGRAGTSASGENIFMGSSNPVAANKGWFFSPGHHKNMFHPAQRRIGLGNFGTHWTQMFGR